MERENDRPVQAPSQPSFTKNVVSNWASQGVLTISGFVLPRLINDSMGPSELGVWDFGWSMRSLISLSGLGMASSAAHHVSRLRATGQWDQLSRMLSAMLALVLYTVLIVVAIVAVVHALTPVLLAGELEELVTSAKWIVVSMGLATILQMIANVYGGVLVGGHRFDLLNKVEIVADICMVAAIFIAVVAGAGLKVMAVCVAARHAVDLLAKWVIAHRLCPELHIRPQWADWPRFKEIAAFGAKTMTGRVAEIILIQGVIAIILFYHNAAALALFARPLALIRHTKRFVMGFARVLVPKVAEAYGRNDRARIQELLVNGTRYSLYLALPIALLLLIMGGPILNLWMGAAYADSTVLVILVIGYLPFFAQRGTWHVLLGMGKHGLPSVASLVGALVSVGLAVLLVGHFEYGLAGAALAAAIPIAIVNLFVLPYAGCRATGLGLASYYASSFVRPCALVLPFAAILTLARFAFRSQPTIALAVGIGIGAPVLAAIYWQSVLPADVKHRTVKFICRRRMPTPQADQTR